MEMELHSAAAHQLGVPSLNEAAGRVTVMRYDPPPRVGTVAEKGSAEGMELDHRPGNLRVHVLEGEGLATRADGSDCRPYAVVHVNEITRRRSQRTAEVEATGAIATWGEAFDFEDTSACAQIVVDVYDRPSGAPSELLGKALFTLTECRVGVPHTYFKHLLEGKLVLRVLFDFDELPSLEEEATAYAQQYAAATK